MVIAVKEPPGKNNRQQRPPRGSTGASPASRTGRLRWRPRDLLDRFDTKAPTGVYGLAHPPQSNRWFDLVARVARGEPIASAKGGKEVHADDVARAIELLLGADAKAVAGQSFNCYDSYISEEQVARIARELTGSSGEIAALNRGPKHQINTQKIRALGMTFGGEALLRRTVAELVAAQR